MFSAADTMWVLLGTVLVFFMQAGFAMVESGFTRAKNAGNIIMKNLMDFSLGSLCYWTIGFGLMYGTSIGGFVGTPDFFVQGNYDSNVPTYVTLMFQTVFCATSATIVSGAMAERTKFSSYCVYSVFLSVVVYPIAGHWIWGGGWLSEMGFHDFAGSTAVHMLGGVAALVGAKTLGPRIGKYDENGNPQAILGHNLTIGALGVFILWFCWFGFNGGSSLGIEGDDQILTVATVFITTNLAATTASAVTMVLTWVKYGKPDVSMSLNGALGGLVAITAGCDVVTPFGAVAIGAVAAFIIVFGIEFVDKTLRIDDPVGAVGVHGMCGAFGTVALGFLSTTDGLLYGHGTGHLMVQVIGVVAVALWSGVLMGIAFNVVKSTMGLRVTEHEEIVGLDIEEHGLETSYADFMPSPASMSASTDYSAPSTEVSTAVAGETQSGITKLSIVTRQNKLDTLRTAMEAIGVTGMTVTQVMGCGTQKGASEFYRGVPVASKLIPKVQVEMVIANVPINLVVDTAKKVLYTGSYGDGKIFVSPLADVVKVRTGEQGAKALLDETIASS